MRVSLIFLIVIAITGCDKWADVTANEDYVIKKRGVIYFENEPFTGHVIQYGHVISEQEKNQTEDTLKLYEVKNGKEHGRFQTWYKSGLINEIRNFKNGRRHGFHQKWYDNGQKAFEYHFDNGVYVDTLKEWYPNGQLYLLSHYKDGQPAGRQKAWRENGELYLNYDVVNGRKYGNAGIKHCKSLWSEVLDSL